MNLDTLIHFLRIRLSEPMSGMEASKEMFPTLANGNRIRKEYDETAREGAVMILLYQDGDTVRFLVIQRPIYPSVHSDQMAKETKVIGICFILLCAKWRRR